MDLKIWKNRQEKAMFELMTNNINLKKIVYGRKESTTH
jgi:hypothetical protein